MKTHPLLLAVQRRLEHLCHKLTALQDRLRSSVAETVGQALGSVVRDAILHVFGNAGSYLPIPVQRPFRSDRLVWDEPGLDDNPDHVGFWPDQNESAEDLKPAKPQSARLTAALALLLQTAAVCLERRKSKSGLLMLVAGVLAGCAAYTVPLLAVVGLGLLGL
jgi:hypothetical protein